MAIALVNTSYAADYSGSSSSTLSAAAQSLSAGNLQVAACRFYRNTDPGSGAVSSVTDTASNTYQRAVRQYYSTTDGSDVEIWYAMNCAANGSNVVSFNLNTSYQFWGVVTAQYSGVALASALDVTAVGDSGGAFSSITSDDFTTTVDDDLIVAVVDYDGGLDQSWSAGSGYAIREYDHGALFGNLMLEDRILSGTATTNASASLFTGGSRNLNMVIATFKPDTGAAGQPTMRRWGGVSHLGGLNIGKGHSGRMWGRSRSGLILPRRFAA